MLQVQPIMAWQADQGVWHHDLGLCFVQHHTPHTYWVNPSSGRQWQMAFVEKRENLAELAPHTLVVCDHDQLAAATSNKRVTKVIELWDGYELLITNQWFYLAIFTTLYGSHSQSKNGLDFPNFMYIYMICFPKCEGKGSFPKSLIKSLPTITSPICLPSIGVKSN